MFAVSPSYFPPSPLSVPFLRALHVAQAFSCGGYDRNGTGLSPCINTVPGCGAATCPLPAMYQAFDATNASLAFGGSDDPSTIGGWSDSMDMAPVRTGYWNCQDQDPITITAVTEAGVVANYTAISAQSSSSNLFGGQSHCPTCRCFKSSLMDLTQLTVNTNFPQYGLCYRANCFRPDYLQIAIKSQVTNRIDWYRCPDGNTKLYIPGYTGAFHCPDPTGMALHVLGG